MNRLLEWNSLYVRDSLYFHIFTGDCENRIAMELQMAWYKPQNIASTCLEIIGKLVSPFKTGHTTANNRSILGAMT